MKIPRKLINFVILSSLLLVLFSLSAMADNSLTIVSPSDFTNLSGSTGRFNVTYIPVYDTIIENEGCYLIINGIQPNVYNALLNNTEQTFEGYNLREGINSFSVGCWNGAENIYSPTQTLYYDYPAFYYNITTCDDLQNMTLGYEEVYYTMQNDVDCSGIAQWTPIGNLMDESGEYNTAFKGHFDGQGHKISNVYINGSNLNSGYYDYNGGWGLFGGIMFADIKNFTLDSPYYENLGDGSSLGFTNVIDSTISNVNIINGTAIMGCVGADGLLDTTTCNSEGAKDFGGFITNIKSITVITTISDSSIEANVYVSPVYDSVLGQYIGSFGSNYAMFISSPSSDFPTMVIQNSYAKGTFISEIPETTCSNYAMGGVYLTNFGTFASTHLGILNNSYSQVNVNIAECGTVTGAGFIYYVGAGDNFNSSIDNSLWIGSISADDVSGIQDYPFIQETTDRVTLGSNNFWDTELSGWATQNTDLFAGSGNSTGFLTSDFSNLTTLGLDPSIWQITDGLPELIWQNPPQAPESNSIPSIVINSPANNTASTSQPTISYTITDLDNETVLCELYINNNLNMSNSSVANNTESFFSPTLEIGNHTFDISCFDGIDIGYSGVYNYELQTEIPSNTAPTIDSTSITPATAYSNSTLTFKATCTDTESSTLTAYCQIYNGSNTYGSVSSQSISNNTESTACTLSPNIAKKTEQWHAEIICGDGDLNSTAVNTSSFTIQNSLPIFLQSNFNYSMLDNESLSLQINATDIDLDILTFTSDNAMFSISSSGLLTNNSLLAGNYTIQINVTDGTATESMELFFEVIYTNKPPVVVEIKYDPLTAFRDTQINFSVRCTDVDNVNLTGYAQIYNGTEVYDGVASLPIFNNTLTQITFLPAFTTHKGEIWHADMWCSDELLNSMAGSTDNATINNSVPTPDPASPIENPEPIVFTRNKIIRLNLNISDLDQDSLNWYSDNDYFPILNGNIYNNGAGEGYYRINFWVSDGTSNLSSWIDFNVTNPNYPSDPEGDIYTGTDLNFSILCVDDTLETLIGYCQIYNNSIPYGDLVTLNVTNNTLTNICNVESGVVKKNELWTADRVCSDGTYNTSIYNGTGVLILNSVPYFEQSDFTYNGFDDLNITLQINGTDIDGDILQFESNNINFPIGLSSGLISTELVSIGTYNVSINVTDLTDSATMWVLFDIQSGNEAPTITSTSATPTPAYKNNELKFNVTCADADNPTITAHCQIYNNTLTYGSVVDLNISRNVNTEVCNVPINIIKKGESWKAEFYCSDLLLESAKQNTSTITILNTAPEFTDSDFSYITKNNESISIQLNATDLDLDTLTYASNNSMFPVDENTGIITDNNLANGVYIVKYSVFDGTAYDYLTATFTITESNTVSQLTVYFPTNNSKSLSPLSFNYSVIDAEQNTLNCLLYIDGVNTENQSTSNNSLTAWNPSYPYGNHSYYVKCTDGLLDSTSATNYYAYYYTEFPVIIINSPADNTNSTSSTLSINYTVTSNNANSLTCQVYLDGVINITQSKTNNTSGTATPTIAKGLYKYPYYINCTDGLNYDVSETRYWTYRGSVLISGQGTSEDPFLINSCAKFSEINNGVYSNYKLNSSLSCGATNIPNSFYGTLDGNNYSISYTIGGTTYNKGLFTQLMDSAVIKNINLTFSLSASYDSMIIGALAIYGNHATIINVSTSGSFSNLHTSDTVGGITNTGGNISYSNSAFTTTVAESGLERPSVAGITLTDCHITKSYFVGTMNAQMTPSAYGGTSFYSLCGTGEISNSWANQTSTNYYGSANYGIGGTSVINSYSLGSSVSQTSSSSGHYYYAKLNSGSCDYSYSSMSQTCSGARCHNYNYCPTNTGSGALPSTKSGYEGWDFVTVWKWDKTLNLPVLRAEGDLSGYYPEGNVTLDTADNLISTISPVINFTTQSDWATTMNCTLYLNDVANESINGVNNNTLTSFNPSVSYGIFDYYVECVDGWNIIDSATQTYTYFLQSVPSVTATASTPATAYKNTALQFNATCVHNDIYTDGINAYCQIYNGSNTYGSEITKVVTNNTNTNICNVSSNMVRKDETWLAQFHCADNMTNGSSVNSSGITIQNTNPTFAQSNFVHAMLDNQSVNLQINASDLDLDSLTYYLTSEMFQINLNSGIITDNALTEGEFNVTISVFDGTANVSMWVFFDVEVSNYAPEIIGTDAQPTTAYKDTQLNFSVQCTEVDDTILNGECQLYNGSTAYGSVIENLVYNNSMDVVCTLPANTGNKGETWKAELWCNDGGLDSAKMNTSGITLLNTAPYFTTTPFDYNGLNNESIAIQLNASDIDSDSLTYTSNNSMFPVDENTGIITDNSLANGYYSVQYSVFDGNEYGYMTSTFTISESNTVPTITSTLADPDPAHTNDALIFSVTCTDTESSILTAYCQIFNGSSAYDSVSTLNISKNVETQICNVPINIIKKGESWKAEFYCSDSMYNTTRQNTSTLTIENTAPLFITAPFSYNGHTLESILIQLNATDIDSDSLTYASNNSMFPVDSNSGIITDNSLTAGTHYARYSVFDGTAYDYLDVTFNIDISNTAPTLVSTSAYPTTAYKETQLNFAVLCTDTTDATFTGYCQIYNGSNTYSSVDSNSVTNNSMSDVCFLPSNTAYRGESWKASLWCGDGEFNSSASDSNTITILNRQPTFLQSDFTYTTSATSSFTLEINATDLDGDTLEYSIDNLEFTIDSVTGIINRTGQGTETAGTYNVTITIDDGLLTNEMWVNFVLTQYTPIVTISNPVNESTQTEPFLITFKAIDFDNSNTDCTIYLDSVIVATQNSVNNTNYNVNTSFDVGNHEIVIECTDGTATGSSNVVFYYDDTSVIIDSLTPNVFDSTVFSGYTMNIKGNVSGSNLSLVNRTIYFPNSSIFFNEEVTNFVDPTFYSWDDTYDTTSYPQGTYAMNIYAEDVYAHTSNRDITFTIDNCIPQWICNAYSSCGIVDTQSCNGVTDSQSCGLTYTGDYSEFSDLSCNYCSSNIILVNQTACINETNTVTYEDLNFATCCSVTGIGTDCIGGVPQNESIIPIEESCSQFYESGDIVKAIYDSVVRVILEFGKWVGGK